MKLRPWLWRLAAIILAPPLAYGALALALAIPTPIAQAPAVGEDAITLYACDNGVHVDLVLPVSGGGIDWRGLFDPRHFRGAVAGQDHIAIGWGSRDFYMATPQWRDFRLDFALKALLWDETVLHVEYRERPSAGADCRQWRAGPEHYRGLADFVRASLDLEAGSPVPVGAGYGSSDAFFESQGRYTVISTCNQWTGQALARAGAPVAPWTPFSFLVAWRLAPVDS